MGKLLSVVFLSGCAFFYATANSASNYDFTIVKTDKSIVIDGIVNQAEWSDARRLDLNYEIEPGENTSPPVKTEAFVTFDSENLYVAFIAYDPSPEEIRAQFADRDTPWQDDFVGICIDPFNAQRRGYEFFVNPRGVQMDLKRSEGNGEDSSWDTIWDSAAKITETGYQVEFAIPFKSINFPSSIDIQTWGFWFFRAYPRDFRYQISHNPFDRNLNCFFCQMPKATGFREIKPGRNLELNPSAVVLNTSNRESSDSSLESNGTTTQLGMNVRWSPTPNITVNSTFNPDFSHVEADSAQFSINRQFSLFYSEKRPFFLDNADIFETEETIVHTRTIADPTFGAKISGKNGKTTWGGFIAEDTITSFIQPSNTGSSLATWDHSSTAAVLRAKRDIFSNSTIGVLITHRGGGDYHNIVSGIDGRIYFSNNDSFIFQALTSDSQDPDVKDNNSLNGKKTEGMLWSMGYTHDSRKWHWDVWYNRRDRDFRADLGFISKVDVEGIVADIHYTVYGENGNFFSRITPGMLVEFEKDMAGNIIERTAHLQTNFNMSGQGYGGGYWNACMDYFEGINHYYNNYGAYVGGKPFRFLTYHLESNTGEAIDFVNNRMGNKNSIDTQFIIYPNPHTKIDLNLDTERLSYKGNSIYTAKILQGNFIYNFSTRFFIRTIIQYTTIKRNPELHMDTDIQPFEKNLFTQFLLNYKINARTLCYLGFSGGRNAVEMDPFKTMNKAIFFKIAYAYSL